MRVTRVVALCAVLVAALTSCDDGDDLADSTTPVTLPPDSTAPSTTSELTAPLTIARSTNPPPSATSTQASTTVTVASDAGPPPSLVLSTVPGQGTEIGYGEIGPPIEVPQPWPTGTIYVGVEPQALIVSPNLPYPDCMAAKANATIGRGGAILVAVWIEGAPDAGQPCADTSETNQIRIPLAEPLGDRRIYEITPDTSGTSEVAEHVADLVIGADADAAASFIEDQGFVVRRVVDGEAWTDDRRSDRINIWIIDGVVDFATAG